MDNQILNVILKDTYTTTQLHYRLRILKDYLLNFFFAGSPRSPRSPREAGEAGQKTAESYMPQDLIWLKSIPAAIYQKFTKDNVYQIFTDLEEQSKKIPVLTIYLTFEADNDTLSEVGSFARKTFNLMLLLETKIDPSLIAGCSLSWKGILRDYSLKRKIEENKLKILESFKRFLR